MKVFVLGSARSGTTLVAEILERHPDVFTFNELHFFEEIWDPAVGHSISNSEAVRIVARLMKNQCAGYLASVSPRKYKEAAGEFLREHPDCRDALALYEAFLEWETQRYESKIACTQTPRNIFYARFILEACDDARIVWMIRGPRGVLCSQKYRWRRRLIWTAHPSRFDALRAWLNFHPITYSLLWNAACAEGERLANDARVARVRFEDLIRHAISWLPKGALAFLQHRSRVRGDSGPWAKERRISTAVVALPGMAREDLVRLIRDLSKTFTRIILIPDLLGLSSAEVSTHEISGMLALELRNNLLFRRNLAIKRIIDLALLLVGAVIALPLGAAIGAAIWIESGRLIFFTHERIGQGGGGSGPGSPEPWSTTPRISWPRLWRAILGCAPNGSPRRTCAPIRD